jgi:hypothetical protein
VQYSVASLLSDSKLSAVCVSVSAVCSGSVAATMAVGRGCTADARVPDGPRSVCTCAWVGAAVWGSALVSLLVSQSVALACWRSATTSLTLLRRLTKDEIRLCGGECAPPFECVCACRCARGLV